MNSQFTKLPDADHVECAVLEKGPTPQTSIVKIQYNNARTGRHEVAMDVLNALFLLNALEALSQEHGYEPLRHPPK
jgi:hypothetical protein